MNLVNSPQELYQNPGQAAALQARLDDNRAQIAALVAENQRIERMFAVAQQITEILDGVALSVWTMDSGNFAIRPVSETGPAHNVSAWVYRNVRTGSWSVRKHGPQQGNGGTVDTVAYPELDSAMLAAKTWVIENFSTN